MSALQFSGLIALLRVSAVTIAGCALAAAETAAPQTAVTQAAPRSAAFWRASALDDVEAAYRMLREDHPGAAPEVGDGQFQKTLEEAHTLAASGALQVDSFAGYAATLARFANAFGDKHVRSRPVLEVAKPDWAGLIVNRRGTHWIVADAEQGSPAGTRPRSKPGCCALRRRRGRPTHKSFGGESPMRDPELHCLIRSG